ncbi:MAG: MBOAT family protein, partial [Oscillospiraceae bacterium]|nr:MBOAT family protein [Oscillospiraceae bacterium]
MLYTFLAAVFGWVLFDTDTLSDAGRFIAAMFGAGGAAVDGYFKYTLVSNCFLLVMCILISGGIGSRIAEYAGEKSRSFKAISTTVLVTGGLLLCTAYLVDASYNPFLYFRF